MSSTSSSSTTHAFRLLNPLPEARIEWRDDGPWSLDLGDRYASRDQPEVESRRVFIEGNELDRRFSTMNADVRIGEIGFGLGRNLLETLRFWREIRCNRETSSAAICHYVGFENRPVTIDDLVRALRGMAAAPSDLRRLVEHWPMPSTGLRRIVFPEDRLLLTLAWGDAETILDDIEQRFDAWYLDGFSPATNPDAFSPTLLQRIAARSRPGATAATYSVAGPVRRAFVAAGFDVQRHPGPGRKREILKARLVATPPVPSSAKAAMATTGAMAMHRRSVRPAPSATAVPDITAPHCGTAPADSEKVAIATAIADTTASTDPPRLGEGIHRGRDAPSRDRNVTETRLHPQTEAIDSPVTIVGGGLAGLLCALALQRRGIDFCLFDDPAARGASTSPAALAHPGFRHADSDLEALSLAGFDALHALLHEHPPLADAVHGRGIDHYVASRAMQRRLRHVFGVASTPETIGGAQPDAPAIAARRTALISAGLIAHVDPATPSLHYPSGLALDLGVFTATLRSLLPVESILDEAVRSIEPDGDHWIVRTDNGSVVANPLVLATGRAGDDLATLFQPGAGIDANTLPNLHGVAGQISTFARTGDAAKRCAPTPEAARSDTANASSASARIGNGFAVTRNTPTGDRLWWVGASYRRGDSAAPDSQLTAHASDDDENRRRLASLYPETSAAHAVHDPTGADIRTDPIALVDHWVGIRVVAPDRWPVVGRWQPHSNCPALWWFTGLASHGTTLGPILAEHLADTLTGAPTPLSRSQRERLDPHRAAVQQPNQNT